MKVYNATLKNKTMWRSRYGPLIEIGSEVRSSNRDRELSWVGSMPRSLKEQRQKPTLKLRLEDEVSLKTVAVETRIRHGVRVP